MCSHTGRSFPDTIPDHVPVVILGGGTVGQSMSLMLARYNIDTLLVEQTIPRAKKLQRNQTAEKEEEKTTGTGKGPGATQMARSDDPGVTTPPPPPHPRAHVLHTRSMEILRELGLEETVHKRAPPQTQWRHFRYVESMLGEELASVDFYRGPTARWLRAASPATLSHLSQPILDEIMGDVSTPSERFPGTVHKLFGYRGNGFALEGSGDSQRVHVHLDTSPNSSNAKATAAKKTDADAETASNTKEKVVTCEYMVAADGANSLTRERLGIEMEGQTALQHFVSVHFTCEDLFPRLRELRRPGMLHFVFNRHVIGVLVAHDLEKGRWVAQFPFYPPHQSPEEVTDIGLCERLVRDCIGSPDAETMRINMHSADAWCMNALVADRFSDSESRVFLVGDSAHQFPPSGGFGLNAGIQDAHNLAWKLASVIHGESGRGILRSYTPERKQVSQALRDLSVDNFHRGLLVPEALGMPPGIPEMISKGLRTSPAALMPEVARKKMLETALGIGRTLNPVLSPPALLLFKSDTLARLRKILGKFESLPLLFPKHDLGLEYTEYGSLRMGEVEVLRPRIVEGVEQYQPRIAPGARFPHIWLSMESPNTSTPAPNERAGSFSPISSLDVISRLSVDHTSAKGKPRWVLLLDATGEEREESGDNPSANGCQHVFETAALFSANLALVAVRPEIDARAPESAAAVTAVGAPLKIFSRLATWLGGVRGGGGGTRGGKASQTLEVWDAEGNWRALVRRAMAASASDDSRNATDNGEDHYAKESDEQKSDETEHTGPFCALVRPDGVVAWCGASGGGSKDPLLRAVENLVRNPGK